MHAQAACNEQDVSGHATGQLHGAILRRTAELACKRVQKTLERLRAWSMLRSDASAIMMSSFSSFT
jgi:hypothetical protein